MSLYCRCVTGLKEELFLIIQEKKYKVNDEGTPQATEEPLFAIVIYNT